MTLTALRNLDARPLCGPVYRLILAVDLEGSTKRTNPARGELRRALYRLMDRALAATEIAGQHLEQPADRGDGMLILIRPHDDVPKTALLGRLVPALTTLLAEHNAAAPDPSLRMRLRVVIHAGEIHVDDWGFYGEELDVAFRLLDSPAVKKALNMARMSPLALVTSDEIFRTIIRHGYLDAGPYQPLVRVRIADQQRRGWVSTPVPVDCDQESSTYGTAAALRSQAQAASTPAIAAQSAGYALEINGMKPRFQVVRTS
ncbi:MAG TPA: hypothetical protein VFW50_26510 [Streptosporangiaceae bacterium]|nr:hypothetical protein [Streptosporangiaceae bacterium]